MRFSDHEIRQNLTHLVRAHTGKPSDISSDVTESDNLKQDAAFNLCSDNDLRMTVPLEYDIYNLDCVSFCKNIRFLLKTMFIFN